MNVICTNPAILPEIRQAIQAHNLNLAKCNASILYLYASEPFMSEKSDNTPNLLKHMHIHKLLNRNTNTPCRFKELLQFVILCYKLQKHIIFRLTIKTI
jgi:hypothetical protein